MDIVKIGQSIKFYRKKAKLYQRDLARAINKSESSVRKYEEGKIQVPHEILNKIADALGVNAYDFMGADYFDERYPNLRKEAAEFEGFVNYIKTLGFAVTIESEAIVMHYEDVVDDDGIVVGHVPVEQETNVNYRLIKDKQTLVYNNTEFDELQAVMREVMDFRFFRKLKEEKKKAK